LLASDWTIQKWFKSEIRLVFPDLTLRSGASSERRLIHVNSSLHKGVIGATFSALRLEFFFGASSVS